MGIKKGKTKEKTGVGHQRLAGRKQKGHERWERKRTQRFAKPKKNTQTYNLVQISYGCGSNYDYHTHVLCVWLSSSYPLISIQLLAL